MSLIPDMIFNTFDELTVEFLKQNGISALILDVDNTLIPYEEAVPRPKVLEWLKELEKAGIKAAFVTNNHAKRLLTFNEGLGLPAYSDSLKPCRKNMKKAMEAMGSTSENTANIGDQIFTDTWAGKRMGIRTYLVPPIKDKKTFFFRFKRWLERPYLNLYRRRHMAS